mmetsp:Transcript_8926/g.26809  ORF Transcript_8926/g.26809 Transcript_8926/m.26809 type:complete len:405 (+) Transcript_8926:125-1339(+)
MTSTTMQRAVLVMLLSVLALETHGATVRQQTTTCKARSDASIKVTGGKKCFPLTLGGDSGVSVGQACVATTVSLTQGTCFEATFDVLPASTGYVLRRPDFGVYADCSKVQKAGDVVEDAAFTASVNPKYGFTRDVTTRVCLDGVDASDFNVRPNCCSAEYCVVLRALVSKYDPEVDLSFGQPELALASGDGCLPAGNSSNSTGMCQVETVCGSHTAGYAPKIFPFINEVGFAPTPDGSVVVDYVELAGTYWNVTLLYGMFEHLPGTYWGTRQVGGGFIPNIQLPESGPYSFYKIAPRYRTSSVDMALLSILLVDNNPNVWWKHRFEGQRYTSKWARMSWGWLLNTFIPYVVPHDAQSLGSGQYGTGLIKTGSGTRRHHFNPGFTQTVYKDADHVPGPNPGQTIL